MRRASCCFLIAFGFVLGCSQYSYKTARRSSGVPVRISAICHMLGRAENQPKTGL